MECNVSVIANSINNVIYDHYDSYYYKGRYNFGLFLGFACSDTKKHRCYLSLLFIAGVVVPVVIAVTTRQQQQQQQ